jgi:hypothetical protein
MTEAEIAAAKAAADKIAADKVIADKAAADKAAADKIAADKVIADKAAADKIIADKAEADRLAAEKLKNSTLSDKEAELLKEVMASKEKLKAATAAAAEAAEKLKAFDGIDPAKAKDLLAASKKAEETAAAAEAERLVKAGEFDRLKTMMATEHKTEMTAAQTEIKSKSTALDAAQKTINDLTVGASFNTSAFIADNLVLPAPRARELFGANFESENGVVVGYDKPKGAEGRTKLVDSAGEPLSFEAAITKLIDAAPDKEQLLKSKLKPGARSSTTTMPARQSSQTTGEELSGSARILAALNKGALKKAK